METSARGEFTLWQGFLPGPECERAMLSEVARRVRAHGALVTFFGKSFDRHRLEDKMRLHGIAPPFEGLPHLDLYHPLRRFYGGAFQDARLQTMERGLCSVERKDDLPGSFAPEAWFDFLAGRPHRLEDVFRHNEDDVLSLVVLAAHLARTRSECRANGAALEGPAHLRAAALARLFEERRDWEAGLLWSARAVERGARDRTHAFLRARLLLRGGRYRAAQGLFAEIAEGERDAIALSSLVELAKIAEHRTRDLELARRAVRRAEELVSVVHNEPRRSRVRDELRHRAERLTRCDVETAGAKTVADPPVDPDSVSGPGSCG